MALPSFVKREVLSSRVYGPPERHAPAARCWPCRSRARLLLTAPGSTEAICRLGGHPGFVYSDLVRNAQPRSRAPRLTRARAFLRRAQASIVAEHRKASATSFDRATWTAIGEGLGCRNTSGSFPYALFKARVAAGGWARARSWAAPPVSFSLPHHRTP